ncbi:MAG: formate dehydrogenase accessory sulfurtransferase FdhD [Actinomycetota bacterium]|nr:formate dehydrogenase accessory sulfurtransferase FdhD [Actinomycetota bacterium]
MATLRPAPSRRVRVREVADGVPREHEDRLATEEPLEIRLAWPGRRAERLSLTMRTPGHDFELAAGFLAGEGLVADAQDLSAVSYCNDSALLPEQRPNVVTVQLARPPRRTPLKRYDGPGSAISACGVCGKQSIEEVLTVASGPDLARRWKGLTVDAATLTKMPETLRAAQRVFESTGGLHAAGLFEADGTPVVVREDIGRHNAVDKVVGSQLLAGTTSDLPVLCVSGRIGFELVQKAVTAGIGLIAAVGAPSSLAVSLAADAGLCTVGFLRGQRFVIYTVPERVGV